MLLKDIVAINGKPGLYEIKAQSKGGLIVESLMDGKKVPVSVSHNISALNEIAFTPILKNTRCDWYLKLLLKKKMEKKPSTLRKLILLN